LLTERFLGLQKFCVGLAVWKQFLPRMPPDTILLSGSLALREQLASTSRDPNFLSGQGVIDRYPKIAS
jgi:hypothetical protein